MIVREFNAHDRKEVFHTPPAGHESQALQSTHEPVLYRHNVRR